MPGPWEKYQQTPAVPPGFRVVAQPAAASTPNVFDQFDPPASKDPWAAFPDAAKQQINAPDGSIVEFPAGTPDDVMERALREKFGGPATPPPVVDDRLPPGFKIVSQPAAPKGDRVGSGGAAGVEGPWTKYQATPGKAPNVFDQFDQSDIPQGFKVVGQAGRDPWAAFPDAPASAPAVDGPWTKYAAPTAAPAPAAAAPATPADQPNSVKDAALSFISGVPRGVVETGMFPITLSRMVEGGGNWLYNKAENGVRYAVGADPLSDEELARRAQAADSSPAYRVEDYIRGKMDDYLHTPETTAGKYAGTIGEFAAPGAIPSKAARFATTGREMAQRIGEDLAGNVLVPAVASEAAGQATKDTEYEGLSRFLGALFGNVGTAAGRAYNAPESIVRRATSEMTDADWRRALDLQDNTTGVRLTGPEAIAQATNGASALPNLLRVVEGSIDGGARTSPFFSARPAQVEQAVTNVFDQIGPHSAEPYTLGPRAADAAGNVIDKTRQGINAQTRPLYDAAQQQTIPQADFAPIAADPRFSAGVERLRGNPELAPDYAHLPDNSIGVVDAVTKDLAARGEALRNAANPLYGPELASRSAASAADARDLATRQSSDYAQALAEQEALRRTTLNPLEHGPVGRVAAARDTASAGNALLPQNPLTGSAGEAGVATRRLAAEDPDTAAALVRQNLADRFGKANTETQEGVRDFAGAKFHKDVAGNDARSALLDAVLRELPNKQASVSMPELLDVLQATGRRKPIGSATEFNRSMNADLAGSSSPAGLAVGLVKSLGTSVTGIGDMVKRAALRGNLRALADMFVDPHSVELIRNANNRGARIGIGEALGRTAAEAGSTLYD